MEAVVKFDCKNSFVHENLHYLPDGFKQPDTPIVPTSFWEEGNHCQGHLQWDASGLPYGAYQFNQGLPLVAPSPLFISLLFLNAVMP